MPARAFPPARNTSRAKLKPRGGIATRSSEIKSTVVRVATTTDHAMLDERSIPGRPMPRIGLAFRSDLLRQVIKEVARDPRCYND
eukprot:5400735-Pyramimonas_sp.AAC.1